MSPTRSHQSASLVQSKWPPLSRENSPLTYKRKEVIQGYLVWVKRNGGIEKHVTETGIISPDQIQQLRESLTVVLPTGREPQSAERTARSKWLVKTR